MGLNKNQITEKGHKIISKSSGKWNKRQYHRWQRKIMKDINYVPQYNRFPGGWVD